MVGTEWLNFILCLQENFLELCPVHLSQTFSGCLKVFYEELTSLGQTLNSGSLPETLVSVPIQILPRFFYNALRWGMYGMLWKCES